MIAVNVGRVGRASHEKRRFERFGF